MSTEQMKSFLSLSISTENRMIHTNKIRRDDFYCRCIRYTHTTSVRFGLHFSSQFDLIFFNTVTASSTFIWTSFLPECIKFRVKINIINFLLFVGGGDYHENCQKLSHFLDFDEWKNQRKEELTQFKQANKQTIIIILFNKWIYFWYSVANRLVRYLCVGVSQNMSSQ